MNELKYVFNDVGFSSMKVFLYTVAVLVVKPKTSQTTPLLQAHVFFM